MYMAIPRRAKQDENSKVVQMLITPGLETNGLRQAILLNVGFCGVEKFEEGCKLLIYWLLR